MAFILIRAHDARQDKFGTRDVGFHNTGVLYVAWLLGYQPLEAVIRPSTEILRQAGMHPVRMGDLARERMDFATALEHDEVCGSQ